MTHSPLICRDCYIEAQIKTVSDASTTDASAETRFVCPDCGNESFSI